jgi:hypothetical protein
MATTAHGTLTADTIETLSITTGRRGYVVVNPSGTGVIWITNSGADPVPYQDGTYACYGVREFGTSYADWGDEVTVKLLSDTDRPYTVEAF